ncbi:Wzz/FepE/Etk N-terminal domain-containing protein [Desemzia sp. C1]|uniref:YveK family protein n=1 Tax=Desemzia sp. C1 TaxID=2892016 RepID=UPI001E3B2B76|nr:Wzz/FepE/Etk N-terminal domain-containing protein [Desemzia sp. C1]MCI3030016.1 Wzz/FepE/Etk N-terminal domain-containing protein [Desemzia sp. C1]MCI3030023.1 Wzz/FepE/Etk N-terminal domain-containing protein [Desemzia sp. C1]
MKSTISLMELLLVLKNNWYVLLIGGAAFAIAAFLASTYLMTPQYSASTNLLVSQGVSDSQAIELGEIETNLRMIQTYRDVIQDSIVLNDAAENLGNEFTAEELKKKIEVTIEENSQVFSLTAFADHPDKAALIANEIAASFQKNIMEVISIENVAILSPAKSSSSSIYPNVPFHTILGGLIGMLFGTIYALIMTLADQKIRTEKMIPQLLNWNVIGVISSIETVGDAGFVTKNQMNGRSY